MTVQTATARPRHAPARRRANGHRLRGWAYASPTALFVLVLFVVPLLLVFRMSASKWPLLSGDQGINFPDNFTARGRQPVLRRLGRVHAEVHGPGDRSC